MVVSAESEQRRAIRVLVRIRQPTIDHLDASILDSECCKALDQRTLRLQNPRKHGSVDATYHSVFSSRAPQSAVHETVGQVVDDAIAGVNSCIMAYGATGTGKTHTMMGPPHILAACSAGVGLILEEHGLIPRLLSDLFIRKPATASVTISYVEIYNESIVDLLEERTNQRHRSKVTVWEDAHGVAHMRHLRRVVVRSLGEAIQILCLGAQQRSTRHTALNQHSSRGHTILQLHVENRPNPDAPHIIRSKINLVDLAGSEPHPGGPVRANSHATETKSINVSLSALIGVVCTLARGNSRTHVPYRDSKLTTILKDSLGGNCSTWVIITLSAASSAYHETHSSLQFANRAAAVTNTVTVNECDDVEGVIAAKDEEIRRLRSMIQQLTESGMASKMAAPSKENLYEKITGLKQELKAEKLRVQQLEARRESAAIATRSSGISVPARVVEERYSAISGRVGPHGKLSHSPSFSRVQVGQQMLSPYRSSTARPASSSSRPSTGSKKARCKKKLPFAVSQETSRIYSDSLQQKAMLSNASASRRGGKQQPPQTLKDLGQQLIRDRQRRLSGMQSGRDSFLHFGFNAEKKLLSLAAAGGDTTHLDQLLAKYKVLSKELAITKLSTLQQGGLNAGTQLSPARSLDAVHYEQNMSYRRLGSSCSWPMAAMQDHSAASSLTSSGKGFGLSSVISLPRANALETNHTALQDEKVHRTGSDPPQQSERRPFGLSALLRGESEVSNQTGGVPATQIHLDTVT